jgi:threonine dehydrogenase-like Zn-dependent dehydrogenase
MATMRAAVWIGGREFQVEEMPVPEPGLGEVRVRIHGCGVCMTDVHTVEGYFGPQELPRVLGHEWGGIVDVVGPDVTDVALGAPVACWGRSGFAEWGVVPRQRIFPIPSGVSLDEAIFVEPLACCVAAVQSARLDVGALVLVTGAGPMGLIVLQLARRGGAARVLVSEPNEARRMLALQLGADVAIDPSRDSLAEAVAEFTRGQGVSAAFETAGHPAPLNDCVNALADGGTAVIVGVSPATARFELPLYPFHRRNLTLRGSYGSHIGTAGFTQAANWLGQLKLQPIISHRFDLADLAAAFDLARSGRGLKIIVGSRLADGG